MIIVSMKDIVKRYGTYLALDFINITIYEGEIIGLLGPNGAGKTTLIKTLIGMEPYESGSIEFFANSKNPFSNINKEKIGLVTQEITIFDELTAKENLDFFASVYGLKGKEKKNRIEEALKFVALEDSANKFPSKFSGGMKRRLNIACALTHRPRFIIMDEPTVGIDPQSRNYILEAVKKLKENGTTILYTTHYMEEVQLIASRVVIMDQEQIIKEGTIDELIQNIQYEEKITVSVTSSDKIPLNILENISGVKKVLVSGSEITIISAAGSGNLDRIISIVKEHAGLTGIQANKPSLNDVFLTLTGKDLRDKGES